jgi:hypothetical protein
MYVSFLISVVSFIQTNKFRNYLNDMQQQVGPTTHFLSQPTPVATQPCRDASFCGDSLASLQQKQPAALFLVSDASFWRDFLASGQYTSSRKLSSPYRSPF